MIGQTNLFDDVLKQDERFVIVVQALEEKNGQLLKRTLREYPGLNHKQMNDLFTHLKELFSEESFAENQSAFSITVYTNLDYTADQIYAHVKRFRGSMTGHKQLNKIKMLAVILTINVRLSLHFLIHSLLLRMIQIYLSTFRD